MTSSSPLPSRTRRFLLCASLLASVAGLGACASTAPARSPALAPTDTHPPIVFLHGNGDMAAQWQTTLWRFESNGWPRDRLFALRHPYPLARDNDDVEQAGRSSTQAHMAFLRDEVARIRQRTGAEKVVLVGNSRGGNAIRNYIVNHDGANHVSHAILGGTPNHGVSAIPGFRDGSEFSGQSPFLRQLNTAKNANGDEVTGPVRWMTIRSDRNDLYAQPDGRWLGRAGQPTHVGFDSPELKGALNQVLPGADHRETAYSAAAFDLTYRFITGNPPRTTAIVAEPNVELSGVITGLGHNPLDPSSGGYTNNLPVPGGKMQVFGVDAATGEREGPALLSQTVGPDGRWGPVAVPPKQPLEFVVWAPGYSTTHYYRSGFARSSGIMDMRALRLPVADAHAPSVVMMTRPRGYLDPSRRMQLDGAAPPHVPEGAALSWAKITPAGAPRPIVAEFEGERIVGRNWPVRGDHLVYLEITD